MEESPFQIYQQIRARATYNATGKVSFEGSAGVQFRQFDSENKTFFVFSLAANYQPFDGTEITLRGYRNIVGSAALEGQDFIATGIELAFNQRFFQRFNLTVATGYENDEYIAIAEDIQRGQGRQLHFHPPHDSLRLYQVGIGQCLLRIPQQLLERIPSRLLRQPRSVRLLLFNSDFHDPTNFPQCSAFLFSISVHCAGNCPFLGAGMPRSGG